MHTFVDHIHLSNKGLHDQAGFRVPHTSVLLYVAFDVPNLNVCRTSSSPLLSSSLFRPLRFYNMTWGVLNEVVEHSKH